MNSDSSVLNVRNVNQNDAGNYNCVAKNSFSEDRVSAILNVEGTVAKFIQTNMYRDTYYLC